MYQAHIFLEVRILAGGTRKAFIPDSSAAGYSIEDSVLENVGILAKALGCKWYEDAVFEKITGTLSVPQEYGLTGLSLKIAGKGSLDIEFHGRKKTIAIEEIRLEEDAGRLTHSGSNTRMDYTNAGKPSIRIKTLPDAELGEEAYLFLNELRKLLQYLKLGPDVPVESIIRCNAYVALAKYPDKPGYFVKLRNLNSFNFVRKAVNSELSRQEAILISGGNIISESRLWNERQNITEPYKTRTQGVIRHFEPAVKSLNEEGCVSYGSAKKPDEKNFPMPGAYQQGEPATELPEKRQKRFCAEYGLSLPRAVFICDEKERADFFEETVKAGVNPIDAAHWISSEVARLVKKSGEEGYGKLTPKMFAEIMKLFSNRAVNSSITKQLIQTVYKTGETPAAIMKKNSWSKISEKKELLPYVRDVISRNKAEADKLCNGEMAPLEFLTGLVMKETRNMADALAVKALIKEELNIRIVYILAFGGAICGQRREDGTVAPADSKILAEMLGGLNNDIHYQIVPVETMLSEELEPKNWASLLTEISTKLNAGTASGIVIAHGTDTLSYTAALVFWLFSDVSVPIVLTASSATPGESPEASENLKFAVETACREEAGVFVALNHKLLSPLNLKFIKPMPDGFTNWNLKKDVFKASGPIATSFSTLTDPDPFVMRQILQQAAASMLICRTYPGLNTEIYSSLINKGISHFILELYETGTGNMRGSDYSLKPLLWRGKKKNCHFYCTSQQACSLNMSEYATSRRVWREGALPMGRLTTESVAALFFAASLVADSKEELYQLMETYSGLYSL